MDFFDKIGKKATEAYKVTADKTGKIAKETKNKFRIGELKTQINDIYEEIGKKVYEKHTREEAIDIKSDLEEECAKIDELSNEIELLTKECLSLRDKKQCPKCFKELEKDANFCPYCGEKQEEIKEEAIQAEVLEEIQNEENNETEVNEEPEENTEHNDNAE